MVASEFINVPNWRLELLADISIGLVVFSNNASINADIVKDCLARLMTPWLTKCWATKIHKNNVHFLDNK